MPTIQTVKVEHTALQYTLTRKNIKHIHLRIAPDLTVRVSAPFGVPLKDIEGFIAAKAAWIRKKQKERAKRPPFPPRGIPGERVHFLGKAYTLHIEKGPFSVFFEGETLKVYTTAHPRTALQKFFKSRGEQIFSACLKDMAGRFSQPLPPCLLKLRTMTSRWGSCQREKGVITLNLSLLQLPLDCIEYVVAHELVHLFHGGHQEDFYRKLSQIMPDYAQRRKKLNRVE